MEIIKFENPTAFYLLFLIPLMFIIFVWYMRWKNKTLRRLGDYYVLLRLIPDFSKRRMTLKFVIFSLAIVLIIFTMANLQVGSRLEEVKRSGVDIVIALDVSNSMLAEDIRPNRLERSKMAISRLIDRLGDDRIALVVFAGQSYTQLPLTHDRSAAKMMLQSVSTSSVSVQGTAIVGAIYHALNAFDDTDHKNKAIIVISDGESHEDDPISAAQTAERAGIVIHTIGIGSPEGAPIPIYQRGVKTGFRRDRDGNTVITRLDEETLRRIASLSHGTYVRATTADLGLDKIFEEIKKMEKATYETQVFSNYESRFQYFLFLALLLLLLDTLIYERKSKWVRKMKLFKVS